MSSGTPNIPRAHDSKNVPILFMPLPPLFLHNVTLSPPQVKLSRTTVNSVRLSTVEWHSSSEARSPSVTLRKLGYFQVRPTEKSGGEHISLAPQFPSEKAQNLMIPDQSEARAKLHLFGTPAQEPQQSVFLTNKIGIVPETKPRLI